MVALLQRCALLLLQAPPMLALQVYSPCLPPPRFKAHEMRLPVRMALTDQEARVSEAMELKPVAAESARSTGLALALDDGTRKSHSIAENTAFVTGFFRGIAKKEAFAQLVTSLYFVYHAMERAFDETSEPSVKALDYPALRRLQSLETDMEYFHGEGWQTSVRPTAATKAYVQRIE